MSHHFRSDNAGPPDLIEPPCDICGEAAGSCECPPCPTCGVTSDPRCAAGRCPATIRDREDAALDALIVLALSGEGEPEPEDFDAIDPASLPELSAEERAALEAIDIHAIIAEAKRREEAQS